MIKQLWRVVTSTTGVASRGKGSWILTKGMGGKYNKLCDVIYG